MLLDDIRAKRDEIIALGAEYGYSNFRVFGSVARGEADEKSDVDLLVDYTLVNDPQKSGWHAYNFDDEIGKLLGRKVDVAIAKNLKPHYARFILPEAQLL